MTHTKSREIRLKNRPAGLPRETDFELAEVELPESAKGEILVQNIYMSVDPYMRRRMMIAKAIFPRFSSANRLMAAASVVSSRQKTVRFKSEITYRACWAGASTSYPTGRDSLK